MGLLEQIHSLEDEISPWLTWGTKKETPTSSSTDSAPSTAAPAQSQTAPIVVPEVKPTPSKPVGYQPFHLPVSNRRDLPADLETFGITLDATVNIGKAATWCAINFQEEANFDYVIHLLFNNFSDVIHFSQKYKNKWTPIHSNTTFTLENASFVNEQGARRIRIAINYSKTRKAYIFSFLGPDGTWLTHEFAPGIPIKFLYYNGNKDGTAPLLNDLVVTPLPAPPA